MTSDAVAILGGSFNPVHVGHVRLAEEIQKRCAFSTLYIVPAKNPPHKPPYEISEKDRLEMVRLAFKNVPSAMVSSFELESEGPSYAIRTIEHFTRLHPGQQLSFILGTDAFNDLPHWYAFPDVMEACNYVIVTRAGWEEVPEDERWEEEKGRLEHRLAVMEKSGLLKEVPTRPPYQRLFRMRSGMLLGVLDARLPEVSSTEIRVRMQMGEIVTGLVPIEVEQYLKTLSLYGTKKP